MMSPITRLRRARRGARSCLAAVLLCAACAIAAAQANPFMSAGEEAAPAVRTPTTQGPLTGFQAELRAKSAEALRTFIDSPGAGSLALLLGAAFVYGVIHAAGPGHRKTVLFSLLLGRKTAVWEPLALGFMASGVHAGAAVAIILVLSLVRGAAAGFSDADRVSAWFDVVTFALVGALSLVLAAFKLARMARKKRADGADGRSVPGGGKRSLYGIVFVTSLVPCPGATMLLLFALYAGAPWLGVLGVLSMSVGMGLVISAAGYLAYAGRKGVFAGLKSRERLIGLVADVLELLSYVLILGFALYALWPALVS